MTQNSTDSVPFISRTLQLYVALMNWHVFPELSVITARGLSLKDKSWKAETYTAFLRLWSYLIWTHMAGWLQVASWQQMKAQLMSNVSLVHHYFLTECGCCSAVKICNWFMYWSVSTLLHGQLTSAWKMVQNEINTSKQHTKSLLKLRTFWEAFAISLRSESVTLSH